MPRFFMNEVNEPNDINEQIVIGILLTNPESYPKVENIIFSSDFSNPYYEKVFIAIRALYLSFGECNMIVVASYLSVHKLLADKEDEIFAELASLARVSRGSQNIISYACNVRDHSRLRATLSETNLFLSKSKNPDADISSNIDHLHREITTIQKRQLLIEPKLYRAIPMDEFIELEFPERELLLSPWLPKGGLTMIHAAPGIGKTHVALNIGFAVATGGKFFGWDAPKKRKTLYCDGEMPASAVKHRLKDILQASPSKDISNLIVFSPDTQDAAMPDLSLPQGQAIIDSLIAEHEIEFIIIDNLSCFLRSGVENEAESWAPMQSWLLRLRNRVISALLIHHQGKGGKQRGSSKKEDILDTIISLKRPSDYCAEQGARFILDFEKTRGFSGEDAKSFEACLTQNLNGVSVWTTKDMDQNKYELAIEMVSHKASIPEIMKELNMSRAAIYRCIKKAKESGQLK